MSTQDESKKQEDLIEAALEAFREDWFSGKCKDPETFCRDHPECGPELRTRIEDFLFVATGLSDGTISDDDGSLDQKDERDTYSGKMLGDFKILRRIGQGGMAAVYEAEQVSLKRNVALKILPSHMTLFDKAVKKFYREAEAGGRQSHPGIVRIYAVGEDEGRHYIAQELVTGGFSLADKLNKLRSDKELPIGYFRVAARMIARVSEALEHAHASGVIHRDVKPSNILMTMEGDPKLSDFGLAKVEDALSLSRSGDFAGTPYYMSPEQAQSRRVEINHRTDIYSLGVTLYEMLSLKRPFEGKTSHEVLKKIVSLEPSDPRKNNSRVPQDLSIICLKAMEKNPEHRYQSMKALTEDLNRFLSGEVILAKPAGLGIRCWKRVKRNPVLSAASGVAILAVLCLVGYILFVSYPRIKAEQERTANALKGEVAAREEAEEQRKTAEIEKERALAAEKKAVQAKEETDQERERADEEAEKAKSEAETTKAVLDFLVGLFESSSPEETLGADITVKEVFDKGTEQITGKFEDQPTIRARLLGTMGGVYLSLGQYAEAEPLFEEASALRRHIFGNDHLDTLNSINSLAALYLEQGRYKEAESLLFEALEGHRRVFGNDHPEILYPINNLAVLYEKQGRYEEAEPLFLEALEGRRRVFGKDHPTTLGSIFNLADLYREQGRYEKAEPLFLEALEGGRHVLGNDHPATLNYIDNLANIYAAQGRYEEAESLYLEAIERACRVLGNDHPETLKPINNLAVLYEKQGRYEKAVPLYIEALEKHRRLLGNNHPDSLLLIGNLANLYRIQGRYEKAEPLFIDGLTRSKRIFGEDHPRTLSFMGSLALLYNEQGRYEEAEPLYIEAVREKSRVLGKDHSKTLLSIMNLAGLYMDRGRYEEAESHFLEALERQHLVLGRDHPNTLMCIHGLATLYARQGRYEKAEPLLLEALEGGRHVLGNDHPHTLMCIHGLAISYAEQGRYEEAEPLFLEALEGYPRVLGKDHQYTLQSMNDLALHYSDQGRYEEAEPLAQELVELTPKDAKEYKARKELLEQIREKLGKKKITEEKDSEK